MGFTRLQKTFLLLFVCICDIFAFNINTERARIYEGNEGTLYGFSMVLLEYNSSACLYIGAPKGDKTSFTNSSGDMTLDRSAGQVQMCTDSKCDNIRVGKRDSVYKEMFGFSMELVPKIKDQDRRMIFCSPMWTDDKRSLKGMCVETTPGNNTARVISLKGNPARQRKSLAYYSLGFSVHAYNDEVLYGVPGDGNYVGSVFSSKTPEVIDYKLTTGSKLESITGYSIYSGKFTETDQNYIIVGSPKFNESGRVDIFRNKRVSAWEFIGDQIGSYLGATLCAVDIDGNGKDDLFVAAPAYTTKTVSEGRVLLFLSESTINSVSFKRPMLLMGSMWPNSRFGTSISSVGDLDNDSFNDVAIGAPFEEDNVGCVYIYNGRPDGKITKYSQRILGTQVEANLRGFGWAISKSVDVDRNGYQDFAVSAILSDRVAILKGRPILKLSMNLTITPEMLPLNLTENDKINITIQFSYTIKGNAFSTLPITYKLIVEPNFYPKTERLLLADSIYHGTSRVRNFIEGEVALEINKTKEIQVFGVLQPGISNFISPIEFRLSNTFSERMMENVLLKPILKQESELVRKITFAKDCGEDGICRSDITLSLTALNGVIVNLTKKIEFKVVVGNDGQNAFLTSAQFFTKSNLRYMGVRMLEKNHRVDCLERKNKVECDVANPLTRNTNIKFVLMYQLPTISLSDVEKGIWLQGFATTESKDINESDNEQSTSVKLITKAEPELTVNSEAFPVKYTKGEAVLINGSEVMSIYFDVHNLGPSNLPQTMATFQIPMSLPDGNVLFTENDIVVEEKTIGSNFCEFADIQYGEESSSGDRDVTHPGKITISTIDFEGTSYFSEGRHHARDTIQKVAKCPDTMCSVLRCPVPEMRARTKIRFTLKLNFTNAREALQTVDYLEISPDIKLEQHYGMKYLMPWQHQPGVRIYRRFVAEMIPGRPINYIWVSAASSAGALCFVMIIWFLIWKYKCCVTKKHTEVKLMKRESLKRRTMRQVSRESGRYTSKEPGSPF